MFKADTLSHIVYSFLSLLLFVFLTAGCKLFHKPYRRLSVCQKHGQLIDRRENIIHHLYKGYHHTGCNLSLYGKICSKDKYPHLHQETCHHGNNLNQLCCLATLTLNLFQLMILFPVERCSLGLSLKTLHYTESAEQILDHGHKTRVPVTDLLLLLCYLTAKHHGDGNGQNAQYNHHQRH